MSADTIKDSRRRLGDSLRACPQLHADWSGYRLDGALSYGGGSDGLGEGANDSQERPENIETREAFGLLPEAGRCSLRGCAIPILHASVSALEQLAGGYLVDPWVLVYSGMRARSYLEKIRNRARRRDEGNDGGGLEEAAPDALET